ncbi:MAG TPA: cobalamin-independent methionine synthase II family protein [Candidatus Lustribacter sp.]|jgi:5-methyltetrahydropteroyltriglutamate--homocysteine methyltransferase|nr:cobalamin-independent methionine synthase II family protein [Candidatus Lustribacter sp.]
MNRSSRAKILTTHVGSLPQPDGSWTNAASGPGALQASVEDVVRKQRDVGLDVINDGEYAKGGDWLSYADERFAGFEARQLQGLPMIARGADRETFADFYDYANRHGTLFYNPGEQIVQKRTHWVCTSPIRYTGQAALAREIELLASSAAGAETFLTTTAPSSLEVYRGNEYYATQEEFVWALAEALRTEYETIARAGLIVQVDDAWLTALWDRIGIPMGLDAFRAWCTTRVDALNHALAGIPPEQIRYHLCWGSWHGPHAFDIEMRHVADIMLRVNAGAYLFEAANARHEHEYEVWDNVKLPAGKIIIPGVITHATDVVEHPALVAQRIRRYTERVGEENVIAGADCGFGGRSHPQIAWAKLRSLVDGAALCS